MTETDGDGDKDKGDRDQMNERDAIHEETRQTHSPSDTHRRTKRLGYKIDISSRRFGSKVAVLVVLIVESIVISFDFFEQ